MDEYKSFFLKYQSRNLSENIKKSKSKKLSNAPEEIKSYFDSEAKESNSVSSSDDEDEEEIDDGIESEKLLVMMKMMNPPIHEKENQSFQP